MINLLIIVVFLGCFCLYNSSSKAHLYKNTQFEYWLQNNKIQSKIIGFIVLLGSLILAVSSLGLSSGILAWLFTTILILSLLVVLAPTQMVSLYILLFILTILFVLELLF